MIKKYLIAVSSGPDSMALLNKYKRKIKAVCHVNYHDREDTDNDELKIRKYCKENNLKLYVLDTEKDDVSQYKKYKNKQTYYRKIRYDFFLDIARKEEIKICLIGHHKDDFIESAYMALNKQKTRQYYGIKKWSNYKNLILYRPLLNKWKDDLQNYCIKKNIDFAIDYSNFSHIYERNKVREYFALKTKKEKNLYYWKIKILNWHNFSFNYILHRKYKKWKHNGFLKNGIIKNDDKYQKGLISLWLSENNIDISKNKIENILKFIISFHGNNKMYRLAETSFLAIVNKRLVIKDKYE